MPPVFIDWSLFQLCAFVVLACATLPIGRPEPRDTRQNQNTSGALLRCALGRRPENAAVFCVGTASAAATRVERRNCALRFVLFAMSGVPLAHALAAAAIIGWLGPGPFAACTGTGHSIGTDHGEQDRRDDNLRAQLAYSDRPLSHGRLHPMLSRR
jgi:hypothetical protein